jgi:hypothetical protein
LTAKEVVTHCLWFLASMSSWCRGSHINVMTMWVAFHVLKRNFKYL